MDENAVYSPELAREIGKFCFFGAEHDSETKQRGLRLIIQASRQKDPEAIFIVAKLILDGVIKSAFADPTEQVMMMLCDSANGGCIQARAFLNAYCEERYRETMGETDTEPSGALVDFDGKPIKINRQGIFTPIDAVLEYENGQNILKLSTNVQFMYTDELDNCEAFEEAVFKGLLEWAGEYEVFGGQKLTVRVELTSEDNMFDNLLIMPVTHGVSSTLQSVSDAFGTKARKAQISDLLASKRSFASSGLKWSVNSRKIICIQSKDGTFEDYREITHVAKHEFGHSLGLGDLYESPGDMLRGVQKGTYTELDSYLIVDKYYNLVMCDHHGPISNNDIEMVILAFRENKMQLYQPGKLKGKISSALGKGN